MKGYTSETIRNVALLGHGGCGKTTFLESALYETGVIKKLGKVEDGNTVSDYDKMEVEKGYSINTSVVPIEWKGSKINFIDTPGYFDFIGEVNAALRAAEAAVIMVDAGSGIQVGTEAAWNACERYSMPRFISITKRDKDEFDFYKTFDELKAKFGNKLVPLSWPLSAEIDDELKEAIAESDEELMEKYFDGEEFTDEEIKKGMVKGISEGNIVPVCSSAFQLGHGIEGLLDLLIEYVPTPLQHGPYRGFNDKNEPVERISVTDAPMSAFVFKTIIDPFVGKISVMKVITGKINSGTEVYNERIGKTEKLGKLFFLRGKEQLELNYAEAGDIVAVAKLQNTKSGDTLCDKSDVIRYLPLDFPSPTYYIAIEALDKNDDEKMGVGLARLREEDPSFVVERNSETHQTLLGGQGDIQLGIILAKLKDRFGVSVKTVPQKIAYRETIKGSSDVQGKHKKQSGGAGQFGEVHLIIEPYAEGMPDPTIYNFNGQEFKVNIKGKEVVDLEWGGKLVFINSVVGGAIDVRFMPAILKGVMDCMEHGPLTGSYARDVRVVVYDGKMHPVDSNELSFMLAARHAFADAFRNAGPKILEPIYDLEVFVPSDFMGDVMSDLQGRRALIMGMDAEAGYQKLQAKIPLKELNNYSISLSSLTGGRASFTAKFASYELVPTDLQANLISEHSAELAEEQD